MNVTKRCFDLTLAMVGIVLFVLPGLVIVGLLLAMQGRPVFYSSERMKTPSTAFRLWKFRTMDVVSMDAGVSGADKSIRITRLGVALRRSRLDELPQLLNVLKGDMTFVGPRPPLRQYVDRFPQFYADVLHSRPGITGLATLIYHAHEAALLSQCHSGAETDAVYSARCIPRKARLDLIYQKNQTLLLDVYVLIQTIIQLIKKRRKA